ncbi:MAG: stage III sporulation protein AA [Ruminococcaceae bacterium]|nr:stage III sporulation protein AA [Oscillospiraceae bacterium]
MLVINNEQTSGYNRLFLYLPGRIRKFLYFIPTEGLEEIRLRLGLPVALYYRDRCCYLTPKGQLSPCYTGCLIATKADLNEGVELISEASLYAVENEIRQGYITIPGGHRVGICGSVVLDNGKIHNIHHISGLNYRISRELIGISKQIMTYICPKNQIRNTLIISPPQCGKTTLLRDVARSLSEQGKKVSIIDERNEISAMNNGYSGYNLGVSSDVLEGVGKEEGMLLMLRSMSPDVIITDELGAREESEIFSRIINSGVNLISTIHAKNRADLYNRAEIAGLCPYFQCFITLSRRQGVGTVEEIHCAD